QQPKPSPLVVRRSDGEIQECSGFIPDAAVVASSNPEAVLARRNAHIKRLAAIPYIMPVPIKTFELVTKKNLLRHDKAKCRIVDFQFANVRGQSQTCVCIRSGVVRFAVNNDFFDVDGRRKLVDGNVTRIDNTDTVPA